MTSSLHSDQVHAQANPVKDDANSQPLETRLTEMSTELERAKGLLQALSDAVDAKVSYVDAQQRYQYVNKQYEEWYETTADRLVGKTIQELMGEDYQYVKSNVESALSGEEVGYGFTLDFPDGQQRYLWITYVPHLNHSSEVVGFFVICQDLTEQKRLEALEQLKGANA